MKLIIAIILGCICAELFLQIGLRVMMFVVNKFCGWDFSECDCGKLNCDHIIKRIA
jgi:hypothetical protein